MIHPNKRRTGRRVTPWAGKPATEIMRRFLLFSPAGARTVSTARLEVGSLYVQGDSVRVCWTLRKGVDLFKKLKKR